MSGGLVAQDTVVPIKERHRNSRELIRTLSARYKVVSDFVANGVRIPNARPSIDWVQDGEQVRCKVTREFHMIEDGPKLETTPTKPRQFHEDFVIQNGQMTSLNKDTRGKSAAALRPASPNQRPTESLWTDALFVVNRFEDTTLVDLLERTRDVKQFRAESFERLLIGESSAKEKGLIQVDVDPKHGYLIARFVHLPSKTDPSRVDHKVIAFREVAPGIYFPVQLERQVFRTDSAKGETLIAVTETRFDRVVVNEAIDPRLFDLTVAAGTPVVDYRTNTSFVVGKDGQKTEVVDVVPEAVKTQGLRTTDRLHYSQCLDSVKARVYDSRG